MISVLAAFALSAATAPTNPSPTWASLKSLVGEWDGQVQREGKSMPTHVEVRLTGDGSALMVLMDKDTPREMVTMIHADGKDILATHYCAAHNQPRLRLVPGGRPNQLVFDFKDGTNIGPGDGHMERLALTFVDANHHLEEWTYTGEKPSTFDYHRVVKAP